MASLSHPGFVAFDTCKHCLLCLIIDNFSHLRRQARHGSRQQLLECLENCVGSSLLAIGAALQPCHQAGQLLRCVEAPRVALCVRTGRSICFGPSDAPQAASTAASKGGHHGSRSGRSTPSARVSGACPGSSGGGSTRRRLHADRTKDVSGVVGAHVGALHEEAAVVFSAAQLQVARPADVAAQQPCLPPLCLSIQRRSVSSK